VLALIASERFDARTMCGSLCLQHKVNECLWGLVRNTALLPPVSGPPPMHVNFI